MTVVVTVVSGMNPHMISGNLGVGLDDGLGVSQSCGLSQATTVDTMVGLMSRSEVMRLLV
jgi:hypothetical protein